MGIKVEIGFENLDKLVKQLEELSNHSEDMCKRAIYDGGAIVGNEMKKMITRIPVLPEKHGRDKVITGASAKQIDGLVESMGLAPIQRYGRGLNTKVGFDGYNDVRTKKYPKGQPNMMIARSINAGTSFRNKFPFVERAASNSRVPAEVAMAESLQGAIDSVVNS